MQLDPVGSHLGTGHLTACAQNDQRKTDNTKGMKIELKLYVRNETRFHILYFYVSIRYC